MLTFKQPAQGEMKPPFRKSEFPTHRFFARGRCRPPPFVSVALITYPASRSLYYYFSDLKRLFDPHYTPNEQDIIRCRVHTTGIAEVSFSLKDYDLVMVDVGGQRGERRKWIHCFQDVTCIVFVVNLSGYDQCLVEDRDAVWTLGHMRSSRIGAHPPLRLESNAGRDDALGFNMSFTMVQAHVDCA